jgi:hypothetical protein
MRSTRISIWRLVASTVFDKLLIERWKEKPTNHRQANLQNIDNPRDIPIDFTEYFNSNTVFNGTSRRKLF